MELLPVHLWDHPMELLLLHLRVLPMELLPMHLWHLPMVLLLLHLRDLPMVLPLLPLWDPPMVLQLLIPSAWPPRTPLRPITRTNLFPPTTEDQLPALAPAILPLEPPEDAAAPAKLPH